MKKLQNKSTSIVGHCAHTDMLGHIAPEAVNGHKYAIGFVDSFSRYCRVYFMKSSDEILENFQQFCADVGQPLNLVSDGLKEFIANDFKKFVRLKGIRLENSAAYTPQKLVKMKNFETSL